MTAARLKAPSLELDQSLRDKAYIALKRWITELNIYQQPGEVRLDERQLSQDLGVSRTPVREAMTLLEQEGFVRTVPRRGIFVVKKTLREILEMITVWAALESMAARLLTERASDAEIAKLKRMFAAFERERPAAHLDEYSDANIAFHQTIIALSGCALIGEMTENLFMHMRAIRHAALGQGGRAEQSIADHRAIIDAIKRRDTARAEALVRQHALDLAAHVEQHCTYLDSGDRNQASGHD